MYLWNHRYLEAAVPPAKGSCCSSAKELLKLLIWKLLPWEAELGRHSCCTTPSSRAESGVGAHKPAQAGMPLLGQLQTGSSEPPQPRPPRAERAAPAAGAAPRGACSRKALGHRQGLWPPLGRKDGLERPSVHTWCCCGLSSQSREFVSKATVAPSRSIWKKKIPE